MYVQSQYTTNMVVKNKKQSIGHIIERKVGNKNVSMQYRLQSETDINRVDVSEFSRDCKLDTH